MKRLITLLTAAVMVAGSYAPASAIDIKVSGTWEIGIGWADNQDFTNAKHGSYNDSFGAAQRVRTQFQFIASETLKGTLGFEIGTQNWGTNDDDSRGGALDADGYATKVKSAFLDWSPVGGLAIRMGVQGVALPSATFGNPILDADVAGITGNYQFSDNMSLSFFWLRPFDRGWGSETRNRLDEMDMFGFSLPIVGENFSVTPWAMYAHNGNESGYWEYRINGDVNDALDEYYKGNTNMWWAGAAIELDFLAPFSIKLDGMYGQAKGSEAPEFSGWLVAGLFEYQTETALGNPGILGWYASGDSADDYKDGKHGKFSRMPVVGTDNAGFGPLGYGFAGSMGCMQDSLISNSGVGTWGAGVQIDGMSFIDNFSHLLRVAYVRGTNDEDMVRNGGAERFGPPYNIMGDAVYLTKKDYAVEFDMVTTWEVEKNLNIYLEANYIILEMDSDVWGSRDSKTANAWKAQILFEYAF